MTQNQLAVHTAEQGGNGPYSTWWKTVTAHDDPCSQGPKHALFATLSLRSTLCRHDHVTKSLPAMQQEAVSLTLHDLQSHVLEKSQL